MNDGKSLAWAWPHRYSMVGALSSYTDTSDSYKVTHKALVPALLPVGQSLLPGGLELPSHVS